MSADIDHRCAHCYTIRLGTAAKYAADHGYDAFTSSLLISPYQNHELLKTVGETMGKKYGVEFYYRDFRPGFREGQAKAREMGLYMQKYCGCIFSEEDRYSTKIEKAKKALRRRISSLQRQDPLDAPTGLFSFFRGDQRVVYELQGALCVVAQDVKLMNRSPPPQRRRR